jgi:hypothetical protein
VREGENGMSGVTLQRGHKSVVTVKVVTMGTGVTHYVGDESLTLGQLLDEMGIGAQMDVRVNGTAVEKSYRLGDADQVLVVPKIRGGAGR